MTLNAYYTTVIRIVDTNKISDAEAQALSLTISHLQNLNYKCLDLSFLGQGIKWNSHVCLTFPYVKQRVLSFY